VLAVLVADADGDGDTDTDADGDGDGDSDADAEGEGDADGDADAEGEGDADGDGEADGDGDALDAAGADEVTSWWLATRWPVTRGADPTVTCTLVPMAGGARSGLGAGCPVTFPRPTPARAADAGT
jgi:hypothetical protein